MFFSVLILCLVDHQSFGFQIISFHKRRNVLAVSAHENSRHDEKDGGVTFFNLLDSIEPSEKKGLDFLNNLHNDKANSADAVTARRKQQQGPIIKQLAINVKEAAADTLVNNPLVDWMADILGPENNNTSNSSFGEEQLDKIIDRARQEAASDDTANFQGILDILRTHLVKVKETMAEYLADVDLTELRPASLFYYMERQDELKNPSWKRRQHRYHSTVDFNVVEELAHKLDLAVLVYADSKDELVEGLAAIPDTSYELVYCEDTKTPNQPAHYIAIDRQQESLETSPLEVVLVVRGTKTLTDAITDLLCETVDFRDGKVHSGFLESGTYLAEQHEPLLEKLRDLTGRETIHLTLIGHSLGGGAAAVAAIEFNSKADSSVQAEAYGFGCPPLLSLDLAEKTTSYITTVINNADVVPRLSPATLVNAVMDVMEFDWIPGARRDVLQLFHELKESDSKIADVLVTEDTIDSTMKVVDRLLEQHFARTVKASSDERMQQQLFLPGKIIHFYKDGLGISRRVVPNTFFGEVDLTRPMIRDHFLRSPGYKELFIQVKRQENLRGPYDIVGDDDFA